MQGRTGRCGRKLTPLKTVNTNRKELAWLARLRTGHIDVNQYLHRCNITLEPQCLCGQAIETGAHFLLQCNNYKEEQQELRKAVGVDGMKVEKLLGDLKKIRAVLDYVEKTEQFGF
jgi:hypothetical protein